MSEVDFENSLREEFVERGLVDALEPDVDEVTPAEEAEAESELEVPEVEGRPRDEQGRFIKEEPEVPEHERFIQERFAGDPAKLAQSYQELERKLGSQGNELGSELRALREEVATLRTPAQPQVNQATVEWFDNQVEENPQQAAEWALQNQQGALYERALDNWYDRDPKGASRFERYFENRQLHDQIRTEIAPTLAPAAEQASNQRFNQAWANVEANYPDLKELGDGILKVAEANPRLLRGLQTGDVADVETVLENLYLRLSRDRGGAVQQAASDAASQNAASARAAKLGATVSSASTSAASGTVGKSAQDRFLDGIIEASKGL